MPRRLCERDRVDPPGSLSRSSSQLFRPWT